MQDLRVIGSGDLYTCGIFGLRSAVVVMARNVETNTIKYGFKTDAGTARGCCKGLCKLVTTVCKMQAYRSMGHRMLMKDIKKELKNKACIGDLT